MVEISFKMHGKLYFFNGLQKHILGLMFMLEVAVDNAEASGNTKC